MVGILTGDHFKAVGGLPCGWLINSLDGQPMKEPKHPVLADGKVRYVGDRVALVVAETLDQAAAAAELIVVEYEELTPVVDALTAPQIAASVHDEAPDNRVYQWGIGDKDGTATALAGAAHVTTLTYRNNRLIPNAMEPRCANASYDVNADNYTLYVANQNPHVERLLMCAFVLGIPEHKMRVVAPDVGGGFGSKIFLYGEETAIVFASKLLKRPIKWTSSRSEAFLSDAHGRDHATTVSLGLDKDGKFVALQVHTTANLGAYLSTFASSVPTILYATLLAGQYATPKIWCSVDAMFTNTAPVDAYRGAGRPEATYVVERIVETAARETFMTVLMCSVFAIVPFIAAYNVANVGVAEADLAVIYFAGGAASLVTAQVIGRLADRYGKRRLFTIVALVSIGPILVATHLPPMPLAWVVGLSVLFFVFVPGRFGPATALVTGSVEPRLRGSFMSFNASLQQFAAGIASLTAGLIIGRSPDGALTHFGAVGWLSVGCTLCCLWLVRRIRVVE